MVTRDVRKIYGNVIASNMAFDILDSREALLRSQNTVRLKLTPIVFVDCDIFNDVVCFDLVKEDMDKQITQLISDKKFLITNGNNFDKYDVIGIGVGYNSKENTMDINLTIWFDEISTIKHNLIKNNSFLGLEASVICSGSVQDGVMQLDGFQVVCGLIDYKKQPTAVDIYDKLNSMVDNKISVHKILDYLFEVLEDDVMFLGRYDVFEEFVNMLDVSHYEISVLFVILCCFWEPLPDSLKQVKERFSKDFKKHIRNTRNEEVAEQLIRGTLW